MVLVLGLGACAKKKPKDDGDVAGDTTSQMQPTDVGATGTGQKIPELASVTFAYNSFTLGGSAKSALNRNAAWLKSNSSRAVQIEGHTDERGTTEYNLALGERRAGAVKDYLVGQGVGSSQLTTISYGEERPVNPGHDEGAWGENRRADFVSAQ